jgi:hypothetical protein
MSFTRESPWVFLLVSAFYVARMPPHINTSIVLESFVKMGVYQLQQNASAGDRATI